MIRTTTALRKATRRFPILALALLAGAGCGDDKDGGPTEPPTGGAGSFQFTIDPATVEVTHGGSATATITLVRVSFDKPVQLSAEGLPAGVTASFSPATVPGNVTTSTITLTASPTAEVGAYDFTVRARADGVPDRTAEMGVYVEPTDDPDFRIVPDADRVHAVQGGGTMVGIMVERIGGFDEPVDLSVEGLSDGMAAMVNDQQLILQLGRYVHVGDHTITIRGDAGDKTRTAELTVRVFQSRPVAAAWSHSLAIAEDGSLWTWGRNHHGQLGHGDATDRNAPARVGADKDWIAVAGGNAHSVALKSDGTLWVAGDNGYGQLGVAGDEHATFQRVGTDSDWVAIAAGDDFTLAIKADRTLWAWGRNRFGQLGVGGTGSRNVPTRVEGDGWVQVAAGSDHTVAVKADGTLWTWGDDTYGQLGHNPDAGFATQPRQVGSTGDWVLASAGVGGKATLAIKDNGTLWAWGRNISGELGLGEAVEATSPQQVGSAMDWVAVSTGGGFTLALDADGFLWATGANSRGRLGIAEPGDHNRYELVQALGSAWEFVSAGEGHTLAIGPDGLLYAWGSNDFGQLGLGTADVQGNGPVTAIRARWP